VYVLQECSDRTVRSGTHYSGCHVHVDTGEHTEHGFIPSLSLTQNSINGVSYGIDVLDDVVVVVVENKYDMPPNKRAFRSMAGGPSTKRPRGKPPGIQKKTRDSYLCVCV
jgi:hypothetical protein